MTKRLYRNTSGLGVFAAEWMEGSTTFSLVNSHETSTLTLSVKRSGEDWISRPVVNPERFGLIKPPKKAAEFFKVVDQWFAQAE